MLPTFKVEASQLQKKKPKNIIFMVMDGTNSDLVTLSRWYKGTPLTLDKILVGGVKTYSLHSGITDSASAATAMATGQKAKENMIGMIPSTPTPNSLAKPTTTILEAAKKSGFKTGIVSTSPVQHATPAAFTAHSLSRNDYDDIAEQQVYQNLDVVLGGGKIPLIPNNNKSVHLKLPTGIGSSLPEYRRDGENLINIIKQNGYKFIQTKEELEKTLAGKVWGSFAAEDISYEIDRNKLSPHQPSLAEMTKKAIKLLSNNEEGFFLFIEGSKVDWAAHKNDPVGMISEVISFDSAVKEALDFASKDQNTLLVAVTDHGNSGLTMGNQNTDKTYYKTPVKEFIQPLKKAQYSLTGALSLLKHDRSNLQDIAKMYGLDPLTSNELLRLKKADDIENELVRQLASRANLGFTTHGHSGEDVFLYAYGPSKPTGLVNNIDLPLKMASFLNIKDFGTKNDQFVNAEEYYRGKNFETKINLDQKENPIFIAKKGDIIVEIPANKNIKYTNGHPNLLKGVSVYSQKKFWICLE